jgi:hypothetical protein
MKITYVKGNSTTFVFNDAEIPFALMALTHWLNANKGVQHPDMNRLFAIHHDMMQVVARKVEEKQCVGRYHLCCKCFKEVDVEKDKYQCASFPNGVTVYSHQLCPPINTGGLYHE